MNVFKRYNTVSKDELKGFSGGENLKLMDTYMDTRKFSGKEKGGLST